MESCGLSLIAYLGPETFIPLVSVIAGAVGALLAFGRGAWTIAAKGIWRLAKWMDRK